MTAPVAVRLAGAAFRYPGTGRDALADITLEVARGSVTWLAGEPGAGCSTLLQVIAGLAPRLTAGERRGEVRVLGADPATAGGRRALAGRIGYVTASPHLQLSGLAATVWEEVAFGPANLGWPRAAIADRAARAMAQLEVSHLAQREPSSLSGGELQRVVLAAMAVLEPDLWLLDEPSAPLDAGGQAALARLCRDEAGRGAAVVITSEDADLLCGVATRLVVLRAGRVVLDGVPALLLAGEEVWEAGAGSTAIARLVRTARRLAPDLFTVPYPLTVDEALARWNR